MLVPSTHALIAMAACLPLLSACDRRVAGERPGDVPALASGTAARDAGDVRAFHYTQALTVEARTGYTFVTIDPGALGRWRFHYALVPRGTDVRVEETEATVIEVPVRRVIVGNSNGLQQYLEDLGVSDAVLGLSNPRGVYPWLTRLYQRHQAGAIATIEFGAATNLERVLEVAPELTLLDFTSADALWPLVRVGVPAIAISVRLERHPLASAEWIKLLGLLFGREREAVAQFARIEGRYRALASRAGQATRRPRVLPIRWGSDLWTDRDVHRQIVVDAGAAPIPSAPGAWRYYYFYPYEVILDQGVDADVWPFGHFSWKTSADIIRADARLAAFRPVREGRVYHPNGRTQPRLTDPFYSALYLYPDAVLADLVRIFHPELLPGHDLVYFRPIDGADE